jgi:hypothetical protein
MLVNAVPVGAAYFTEWLQYDRPQHEQEQVAWIRLCDDQACTSPRAGVPVHTVWNFASGIFENDWQTGTDGKAAIRGGAGAVGETVRVDVSFVNSAGNWQDGPPLYFTTDADTSTTYTSPDPSSYQPPANNTPASSAPASQGPVSGYYGVCPDGYPIKANDNSGIYHVPGGRFYDVTNARNCFATEGAAQAAGYRKSEV